MSKLRSRGFALLAAAALSFAVSSAAQHDVVATTPDLAALCRAVGGEHVRVTSLARGPEDPHFLDARPGMLRACSRAQALVEVGRELEIGWLPVLISNCRNGALQLGGAGRIDAGGAVRALGLLSGRSDRSQGDVHPLGNPHYLTDPLCGLQVATLLRDRFAALWPDEATTFAANFAEFRQQLAAAMVGSDLAAAYGHDAEKLALLFGAGRLGDLLREQGDLARLGGWFGEMLPLRGGRVVADHDLWPYFAERFGLSMVGFFEPRPGVAPTTANLQQLVEQMRRDDVRVILSVGYFAPRHAELVSRATGAAIVAMLHQAGAIAGTEDYVAFVDYNVRAVAAALRGPKASKE